MDTQGELLPGERAEVPENTGVVHEERQPVRPANSRKLRRSALQRVKGLPIGFVAEDAGEVFLIFRGTMTTSEWLHDLNIRLASYPHFQSCKVHEGFLQTYNVFRAKITDCLGTLDTRKRPVHSRSQPGIGIGNAGGPGSCRSQQGSRHRSSTHLPLRAWATSRLLKTMTANTAGDHSGLRTPRIWSSLIPLPVPFLGFIGGISPMSRHR